MEIDKLAGASIQRMRKSYGVTQDELAAHLGVSVYTISRYETGKNSPPLSLLQRTADLLGISLPELLGIDGKPTEHGGMKGETEGRGYYIQVLERTKANLKGRELLECGELLRAYEGMLSELGHKEARLKELEQRMDSLFDILDKAKR